MNVARTIERFLEQTVGLLGRIVPGTLEPVTLVTRLVREADLAIRNTSLGPVAPNHFEVGLHPGDLPGDELPMPVLERAMAASLEEVAADRGWRLAGPMKVLLNHHDTVAAGTPEISPSHAPGPRPAWGSLTGDGRAFPLANNRLVIGRSPEADVSFSDDTVSRRHALLWRADGEVWIRDLGSANGTLADGVPASTAVRVGKGSVLTFGRVSTRLEVT